MEQLSFRIISWEQTVIVHEVASIALTFRQTLNYLVNLYRRFIGDQQNIIINRNILR